MNLSVGGMAPKLKMILILVAAAAALTVTLVAASAPVGAYSGGTGTSSTSDGGKYRRLWDDLSRRNKRWANRTAECESGKDPDAIGGGARTAVPFSS